MAARAPRDATGSLREQVVRHAAELIAQRGFEAVSVADVAQAVGLSKQALMYHFKTKESLKHAVLERLLEHANRTFIGFMSKLNPREESRLEQSLATMQDFFDEQPHAARVVLRFILDEDREAIARILEGAQPWFRVLVEAVPAGRKRDAEAVIAQVGMLVLTNFAMLPLHGWTDDSPAQWRKRRLMELVRAVRAILQPAPPLPLAKKPTAKLKPKSRSR